MDKEYNRQMRNSVDALNKFIAYCEERGYTGSTAILKGMLEEANKLAVPDPAPSKPVLRLVGLELPMELRQVQAVDMVFRYVLNEHPFLALVPKQAGKSITVSDESGINVKYQIEFRGSHTGADLYVTTITVNPKWVIRISTVVAKKKFSSIQITSNFGKDYFGLDSAEQEFTLRAEGEREAMWVFVNEHIAYVTSVIHKANI